MSTSTSRRGFLQTSLAAGAMIAGGALPAALARSAWSMQDKAAKPMRILILGGTGFIGPALVAYARQRGHTISIFNRGKTEARVGSVGDDVERLVGDRDPDEGQGIASLQGKQWDVCLDDTGYYPRHVKASAELLAPNVKHYIFVSTISVYADNSKAGQDETATLAELEDPTVETMGPGSRYYGGLKVLCERAAEAACPGRTTIVRPGFIVGPGDGTDRFTWWPWRVQHSGREGYGIEMLAPGTADDPVQVIDVRDLAAFMVTLAEKQAIGVFNACGPEYKLTMGKLLDESKKVCAALGEAGGDGAKTQLTWVNAAFLRQQPARLNTTIWIPPEGSSTGFHQWSNAAGIKAGMTFRPIAETIKDTLEWFPKEIERRIRVTAQMMEEAKARGEEPPRMAPPERIRTGYPPEAEKAVLEAWHAAKATG